MRNEWIRSEDKTGKGLYRRYCPLSKNVCIGSVSFTKGIVQINMYKRGKCQDISVFLDPRGLWTRANTLQGSKITFSTPVVPASAPSRGYSMLQHTRPLGALTESYFGHIDFYTICFTLGWFLYKVYSSVIYFMVSFYTYDVLWLTLLSISIDRWTTMATETLSLIN